MVSGLARVALKDRRTKAMVFSGVYLVPGIERMQVRHISNLLPHYHHLISFHESLATSSYQGEKLFATKQEIVVILDIISYLVSLLHIK